MVGLSAPEVAHVIELLEELEAVVEADDGTLVPYPLVEKIEVVTEIFKSYV